MSAHSNVFTKFTLNCWKLLKLSKLQSNTLNGISLKVTKVEKIRWMAHG
nr:MAG TPA: hypothetical protein [Caudoviricetes sp.]